MLLAAAITVAVLATLHWFATDLGREGLLPLDHMTDDEREPVVASRYLAAAAWVTVGTAAIL